LELQEVVVKSMGVVGVYLLLAVSVVFGQAESTGASHPITVPAGTHMLMKLVSPIHTVSATDGSAVYLETTMPVIADNRVVIPAHTQVMGTVVRERRPGRVKGRAQLRIRFTQFIFADSHVVSIDGAVQGLPNSLHNRRVDAEGTIEPVDQIDRDVRGVVAPAIPGAVLAALGAPGAGARLALLGGGLGLGHALISRGNEIALPVGTAVEMVLKRDLQLDRSWMEQSPTFVQAQQANRSQEKTKEAPPCDCFQD
jgi:type IV secretion system protein VirB10